MSGSEPYQISQEVREGAQNGRDWMDAYMAVGFSHEEALQLLLRPFTVVNNNMPPRKRWWQK